MCVHLRYSWSWADEVRSDSLHLWKACICEELGRPSVIAAESLGLHKNLFKKHLYTHLNEKLCRF